jgi:hypothetical protein
MPFGKYRGLAVDALPDTYLQWLYDLDDLREPLRSAVYREWSRRFDGGDDGDRDYHRPTHADDFPDQDAALFRELIEAGYRALALKLHPDQGGSVEAMQRLNALVAKLRRGVLAA